MKCRDVFAYAVFYESDETVGFGLALTRRTPGSIRLRMRGGWEVVSIETMSPIGNWRVTSITPKRGAFTLEPVFPPNVNVQWDLYPIGVSVLCRPRSLATRRRKKRVRETHLVAFATGDR